MIVIARCIGCVAVLVIVLTMGVTTVSAAPTCQLVLGFRSLHDLVPEIVGDCLVDEHHNPDNGDGLQETARGLLVWRKADNFTAFTDGYRSWVNGPNGLQVRLNTESFSWERANGRIFLVRIDDGGRNGQAIGCGDSLIAIDNAVPPGSDRALQVRSLLTRLFNAPSSIPPAGLYNVFAKSMLRIDDVRIDDSGLLEVRLSGLAQLGGVCDAPRFEGQIKATLQQFSWVRAVTILVNGTPVVRIFSGHG